MSLQTFTPQNVSLIFAGIIISSFADGDAIKLAREENVVTKKTGVNGDVARSVSRNKSGTITLKVFETAPETQALLAQFALLEAGADVAPLIFRDFNSLIEWTADAAWIAKLPEHTHSKDMPVYEWTIDCEKLIPQPILFG